MSIKTIPLWKWALLLVVALLLTTFMYGIAMMPGSYLHGWPSWLAALALAPAMLFLYQMGAKLFEKEWAADLPMKKCAAHVGLGLAAGFGYMLLVVGVMIALDLYSITAYNPQWMPLIDAFFYFLIVATGEEIIFRGVLFRWLDHRWGLGWALVISGLLFGLMHIFNDNATLWSSIAIALEAGILLGMAYKWAGNLWFPIGIHWSWNFAQGNIFGFAVSGQDAGSSLFLSSVEGPEWLTGGNFGAEASVIATVIGLAFAAFLLRSYLRREA